VKKRIRHPEKPETTSGLWETQTDPKHSESCARKKRKSSKQEEILANN